MRSLLFKQLFIITIFILVACQEDAVNPEPINNVDEDMLAAIDVANDYLGSKARNSRKSITVLKFKDGKLYYNTNTDDVNGYQEVHETTVTAYAKPGEFVFWYGGGGVNDLEEIDFDEEADKSLEDYIEEANADLLWVVQVPPNLDPSIKEFKYDIVYQFKQGNTTSDYIRLDPKLGVVQSHDDPPAEEEEPVGGE